MLFHDIRRSFMLFAALQAVKRLHDPMYFLRLLDRPEHLKPKQGKKWMAGSGESFPNKIKQQARDEANHTCVFCATKTNTSATLILSKRSAIDHAIPKSRGGTNNIENAQNTCYPCNLEKGTLTTKEYLVEKFGPKGLQLIRRS